MLVLSRKIGERILITDAIVVTILEVHGNRVRLGFDAPPEVEIRREELSGPMRLGEKLPSPVEVKAE